MHARELLGRFPQLARHLCIARTSRQTYLHRRAARVAEIARTEVRAARSKRSGCAQGGKSARCCRLAHDLAAPLERMLLQIGLRDPRMRSHAREPGRASTELEHEQQVGELGLRIGKQRKIAPLALKIG